MLCRDSFFQYILFQQFKIVQSMHRPQVFRRLPAGFNQGADNQNHKARRQSGQHGIQREQRRHVIWDAITTKNAPA